MGAEAIRGGAEDLSSAAALVAGARGSPPVRIRCRRRRRRRTRPYQGRLAKAVFLSERVGDALAERRLGGAGAGQGHVSEAAARARQAEPELAAPAGATPPSPSRLARRRALAQGMVALVATPEARAESVAASEALLRDRGRRRWRTPGHRHRAWGWRTLPRATSRRTASRRVTPYLYAYLMVQNRLAFERQSRRQGPRGPEDLRKEIPDLPAAGPGVHGSAGQGRRRRHRRPALPRGSQPPNIPETSIPTPAAATNEAVLGACSEHAPSNLQNLRYRFRHDSRTHRSRRLRSPRRAGDHAGPDQPGREDDSVPPRPVGQAGRQGRPGGDRQRQAHQHGPGLRPRRLRSEGPAAVGGFDDAAPRLRRQQPRRGVGGHLHRSSSSTRPAR